MKLGRDKLRRQRRDAAVDCMWVGSFGLRRPTLSHPGGTVLVSAARDRRMTAHLLDQLRHGDSVRPLSNIQTLPPAALLLRSVGRRSLVRSQLDELAAISTASWRGYIVYWSIRDRQLFLDALYGTRNLRGSAPLFAAWCTRELRVQRARAITQGGIGFDCIYEREQILRVAQGRVVEEVWIHNVSVQPPFSSTAPRGCIARAGGGLQCLKSVRAPAFAHGRRSRSGRRGKTQARRGADGADHRMGGDKQPPTGPRLHARGSQCS